MEMMLMAREWAICHIVRESTGEPTDDGMIGLQILWIWVPTASIDIWISDMAQIQIKIHAVKT